MIIEPLSTKTPNGHGARGPCTTGVFISLSDNPLCAIVDGDRTALVAANDFRWPVFGSPWPLSRHWVSGFDTLVDLPVHLFGRRVLVERGWKFLENLFEGGAEEHELALPELRAEEARDWMIRLLEDWRAGVYSYLEISGKALKALDSWVGHYLLLEGEDSFDVLAELTTLDAEPADISAYVAALLLRV